MKKFITIIVAFVLAVFLLKAQEIQFQYDFSRSNQAGEAYWTTTITGTHPDNFGSTFYFVDFDFAKTSGDKVIYGDIQRSLNFWQNTKFKDLSVLVEYNGGLLHVGGNFGQAFLTGLGYAFHDDEYRNYFEVQALYRKHFRNIFGDPVQAIPVQISLVWTCTDLFDVKGLLFTGFLDFWWQDGYVSEKNVKTTFTSEPQLWYNVGQHFGVDNLHVGGEVEVSMNMYSATQHVTVWPAAGVRWTF